MWSIRCDSVARSLACHLKKCRKKEKKKAGKIEKIKLQNIIEYINEYGQTKKEHNFRNWNLKEKATGKKVFNGRLFSSSQ